jgi:CubicO group peptidase (beta-lactamase class C family)
MCITKRQALKVFSLAIIYSAMIFSGLEYQNVAASAASEFPVEGAVYHVHRPGGKHKTYLDIFVGSQFPGKLPDDIDSITVTGPNGDLPIVKSDFHYNPKTRVFWAALPGFPKIGKYTFKLVSGTSMGSAKDTQSNLKTVPIPDVSKFKPVENGTESCRTPVFSWPATGGSNPLYYQLEIRDLNRRRVYRTDYIRNMASVRIAPDILKPGVVYQWRIIVADGSDWISINNRSQSRWIDLSINPIREPCHYQYAVPMKEDKAFDVSSLKSEGVDPGKISELIQGILDENFQNIHSLLIVKNGKLVLEEYFYGYARHKIHSMMSVSKSITSLLVGIAIDKNKISDVNKPIYDFFSSYKHINWDGLKNTIRLKHVLDMTAGLDWNYWVYPDTDPRSTSQAMIRSDDWISFVLEREMISSPGKIFIYSNGLSLLLGEVLRNATGGYADQLAEEYLFDPLGITDYSWQKLSDGTINTAWGLKLKPYDMAKIGYLMLKEGQWRGKQVISSEWVKQSINRQSEGDPLIGSGYGYQWWRGGTAVNNRRIEAFYAAGKGGQYIFVCPEFDLVTIFTSKPAAHPMGEITPQILMANYIIPSMLPAIPLREVVKIDSEILETYVGDYEYRRLNIPLTIFKKGDNLFFSTSQETGGLFAESATEFYGTHREIGDFRGTFIEGNKGKIKNFSIQVGFGIWRFDKAN